MTDAERESALMVFGFAVLAGLFAGIAVSQYLSGWHNVFAGFAVFFFIMAVTNDA